MPPVTKPSPIPTPKVDAALAKQRKARAAVDPRETPDARFKRVGGKRLGAALKAMKGIEQLGKSKGRKGENGDWKRAEDGSTSGYSYSPEQAEKVIKYLTDAVAAVKVALAPRQPMGETQNLIDL